MELRDYLRVLRNRWRIVVLCAVVGIAAGALYVIASPEKYQSQTQLFVSTSAAATDPSTVYQGGQFTEARVQSYADIVGGPLVAQRVATQLGGGLTAAQVEREVTASAPANTVLLNVTVTDRSPARAQAIAAGIGEVFPSIVHQVEATDSSGQSLVKVSVVKPATYSASPTSPKTTLDVSLGLVVGLLVGIGGAVLRETLDTTVKTTTDLQAITGAATIGAIAYDPEAKRQPLISLADHSGSRAEAFRQLRTNLQFVEIDSRLRSIVFSSSVPAEGKTTTVCNLAITLAQAGVRVLLVEADLRRPRVGQYLGLDSTVGLTNVLIGSTGLEDAVQTWNPQLPLRVLASGPNPPNPSELLGSREMGKLLRAMEDAYDLVIIDAPPLLPVTDAAVLAAEASGAVIVVHHGKTRIEQVERAAAALEAVGSRILGCIINFAPHRGPDAAYYGYAYRYTTPSSDLLKRTATVPGGNASTPLRPANGRADTTYYPPATPEKEEPVDRERTEPTRPPAAGRQRPS
ncbi:MAG TPA: polysaccharide biosynthesis tyrosine autokinase [Mycobacteriales bacterium]|nr:polysaccharide biosynthesis tyrosine autokinase [Mycobacteriales bacterium]HVW81490.1 polysaccharide biosynthesis tyrosine autokinase [Mycobacteriales bacterium]